MLSGFSLVLQQIESVESTKSLNNLKKIANWCKKGLASLGCPVILGMTAL